MTHDIFISHAAQDRDAADAACAALEQRGLGCWIAPRDLPPSRDHDEAIAEAIGASRLFLLIFSADSNGAVRTQAEVDRASGANVPILALRLAEVEVAPALAFLIGEWLDATKPPLAPHLDHLGDRAMLMLGRTTRGPLLPTLPPRPFPPQRRRSSHWLPVALAGLGGLAAIALAAAYVSGGGARP